MVDMHREFPKLVIYDLDGVITLKDTFTALVIRRLVRSPLRLLRALPKAVTMVCGRKEEASRKIAEIALAGMTDASYCALADQLGREIAADTRWIRPCAVQLIRRQHASGARIVVATATERRLAESLLAAAEVPYDLLSASLLDSTPSGLTVSDHRVGARKKDALLELNVPIPRAEFVTDSMTDLPTAKAASSVVLIGASKRTQRRFRETNVALIDPS